MNIGIVSLGLIGGSILKSLYGKGHNLFAVTRNLETVKKAKQYTNNISTEFDILKNCDIVFVASPINQINNILDKLENYLNANCIVLDCASVKELVMKKHSYKFIASHPMAGTERKGFDASFDNLFNGAVWVITPFEDTLDEDIKTAENIISLMGAKIIKTTAKEHDKVAALISHFPLLVSQALLYTIKDNKLAKQLASSGFRDMTRLCLSNIDMALDMFNYNSNNIDIASKELFFALEFIKNSKDFSILSEIKNLRSKMYSQDGKNVFVK